MIPSAVDDAKMNADRNGISNCVFVAGKAEDQLAGLIKQAMESLKDVDAAKKKIVAVVDPPRAGLRKSCILLYFDHQLKYFYIFRATERSTSPIYNRDTAHCLRFLQRGICFEIFCRFLSTRFEYLRR